MLGCYYSYKAAKGFARELQVLQRKPARACVCSCHYERHRNASDACARALADVTRAHTYPIAIALEHQMPRLGFALVVVGGHDPVGHLVAVHSLIAVLVAESDELLALGFHPVRLVVVAGVVVRPHVA